MKSILRQRGQRTRSADGEKDEMDVRPIERSEKKRDCLGGGGERMRTHRRENVEAVMPYKITLRATEGADGPPKYRIAEIAETPR